MNPQLEALNAALNAQDWPAAHRELAALSAWNRTQHLGDPERRYLDVILTEEDFRHHEDHATTIALVEDALGAPFAELCEPDPTLVSSYEDPANETVILRFSHPQLPRIPSGTIPWRIAPSWQPLDGRDYPVFAFDRLKSALRGGA